MTSRIYAEIQMKKDAPLEATDAVGDWAKDVDWVAVAERLMAIGAVDPQIEVNIFRNLASAALRNAQRFQPDKAEGIYRMYAGSPNVALQELGNKRKAYIQARSVPLQMRFTAIDGREVDLEKLRGKVVVVMFSASTWCVACKVLHPKMKEIYKRYQKAGLEVVGIMCESGGDSKLGFLQRYTKEWDIRWPQYFSGEVFDNDLARPFGLTAAPEVLLLDKKGLLIWHYQQDYLVGAEGGGVDARVAQMEALIRRQLSLPPVKG